LDDVIDTTVMNGGIRQVVLIAAGMDARAFRLEWPRETRVFEVDHPELLLEKQARLNSLSARPRVDRRVVEVDLTADWLPALCRTGFDSKKPTVWVAEALLFFLTDGQARFLLDTLAAVSARGSVLAADVLSAALLHHIGTQPFLQALGNDGIPWLFGTDEPEEYFRRSGWQITDVKQPGQEGAGLGRWPYRWYSRGIPNVPRNWLVQATIMDGWHA
jgi:methyltransferase (TIGR00027 family)